MEVLFLVDVKGVAHKGEVRSVSDGYALNFLLPRALAEVATSRRVAATKERAERQAAGMIAGTAESVERVNRLAGQRVSIVAKANPKGGLFAAVTAEDIIKHLSVKLSPEQIFITEPIKTVGEHTIEVRSGEATATITIDVKPE